MVQGSAESSAVFCVGIAPELAALDRELAAVGGAARGDADDVYACGPPGLVFEAVARFAESIEREVGLVMRPEKLLCFSHNVDLFTCPERVAHGVPVGILRDEAGEPLLVPCGRGGAPRQVLGITVGGVPLGEEDFEMEWMARRGATVVRATLPLPESSSDTFLVISGPSSSTACSPASTTGYGYSPPTPPAGQRRQSMPRCSRRWRRRDVQACSQRTMVPQQRA